MDALYRSGKEPSTNLPDRRVTFLAKAARSREMNNLRLIRERRDMSQEQLAAVDLLTALVLHEILTPEQAGAMIRDSLDTLLQSHPEHEAAMRECAATLTAQIGFARVNLKRAMDRDRDQAT